ncbi:hypothetical protein Mapa_012033 [Marchantia paleacea]|nr:hypothetical protein Mapa_012033 [Marchantia paleacea]
MDRNVLHGAYFGNENHLKMVAGTKLGREHLLTARTSAVYSVLHLAAISEDVRILDCLMNDCSTDDEKRILVNSQDLIGRTPLHRAVLKNGEAVVKYLLDCSHVDVGVKDMDNLSALQLAALMYDSKIRTKPVDWYEKSQEIFFAFANHPRADLSLGDSYSGNIIKQQVRRISGVFLGPEELSAGGRESRLATLPPLRAYDEFGQRQLHLGQNAGILALQFITRVSPAVTLQHLQRALETYGRGPTLSGLTIFVMMATAVVESLSDGWHSPTIVSKKCNYCIERNESNSNRGRKSGKNFIHLVAFLGNVKLLNGLRRLSEDPYMNSNILEMFNEAGKDEEGHTPLDLAALGNHNQICPCLLQNPAVQSAVTGETLETLVSRNWFQSVSPDVDSTDQAYRDRQVLTDT